MFASFRSALAVCLGTLVIASFAIAQDCVNWSETVQPGAPIVTLDDAVDVDVVHGHGLVVTGNLLTIHDLADPNAPVLRSWSDLGDTGSVLAVAGRLAAVGVADHVRLVDWHDEAAPVQVADLTLPAAVTALDLVDGRLAVGCGAQGLFLFDVTVPGAPVAGGSMVVGADVLDLSSAGDLLLVAAHSRVLSIDVSDLADPATVATWNQSQQVTPNPWFLRVVHLGDHAAVLSEQGFWEAGEGDEGVIVRHRILLNLDVDQDGSLGAGAHAYAEGGEALDVDLGTAWVSGEDGVHFLTVPPTGEPVLQATLPDLPDGGAVAAGGTRVLVCRAGQVAVLDTTYPGFVPALTTVEDAGEISRQLRGQFLLKRFFQADGQWMTWGCNVSDLSVPGEVIEVYNDGGGGQGFYHTYNILRAWPGRVAVRRMASYGSASGLTYVDLRTGTPAVHEFADGGLDIVDLAVSGDRMYLRLEDGISLRDASQPAALPELASFVNDWGLPWEVAEADPSLVAVPADDELLLLDWTDPASPIQLGACPITMLGGIVAVTAGRAYVVNGDNNLTCVDISDPGAPERLWTALSLTWLQFEVHGNVGLMATSDGLQFLDLSGDTGPVNIGAPLDVGLAWFAWADNELYINDDHHNVLQAWDVSDPGAPWYLGRAEDLADSRVSCFDGMVATTAGTYPRHCLVTAIDDPGQPHELPPVPRVTLSVAPNPFNPQTTVSYELAAAGQVHLALYDLAGRRVRTLVDQRRPAGRHAVLWDGRDDRGRTQASGVYVARLETEQRVLGTKLVLAR